MQMEMLGWYWDETEENVKFPAIDNLEKPAGNTQNKFTYQFYNQLLSSTTISQYILLSTLSNTAHELGHKWYYNAKFPRLVTEMKVNPFGGFVKLNHKYHTKIRTKALICSQTRWKLIGGLAAGPIAGCLFNLAVLGGVHQYEEKSNNHSDHTTNFLLITKAIAHLKIIHSIGNVINLDPQMDGGKIFSLMSTKHLILSDSYTIQKLASYKNFTSLANKNAIPIVLWGHYLDYYHEKPLNEVASSLKTKKSTVTLIKKETQLIYAKSNRINIALQRTFLPCRLFCGIIYIKALGLLNFEDFK